MTTWQAAFSSPEPVRVILTDTSATEVVPADDNNKQAIAKIHICNVTASPANITIEAYDGSTSWSILNAKAVAAHDTLDVYDEILQVGHALRATAGTANALHVSVIFALPPRV